jgi:hypothetical protein
LATRKVANALPSLSPAVKSLNNPQALKIGTTSLGIGLRPNETPSDTSSQTSAITSKNLYTASDEQLKQVSIKLAGDPKLGSIAKKLSSAIDNKDTHSKNVALFIISQNPQARQLLQEK